MRCNNCGKDFKYAIYVFVIYPNLLYNQAIKNELSIKDFFVNIFNSQPAGVGDKMFASGTVNTTPTPDVMLQEWNKPWLYARFLFIGILFEFLCYFIFTKQHLPGGLYMLFCLGSMVVPLAVLIFYWEINIPRDIPLYRVIIFFFIGGVLSIIFTLLLPHDAAAPSYFAPLTEEPGKVIALAIFIYWIDCRYIFGGMLIGAAVGAGFAAFEDIQYVMHLSIKQTIIEVIQYMQLNPHADVNSLMKIVNGFHNETYKLGIDILISRSLATIGGHVTFAAIEGGALALVKRNDSFKMSHFFDPRFLAYLGAAMALHWAWNYVGAKEISLHPLPYVHDAVYLVITAIAIFVAFTLIQLAVKQVLEVANTASNNNLQPQFQNTPMLLATSGPLVNALFPVAGRITLGRDPAMCNVVFPSETPGISRRHCVLEPHSDGIYVMDIGSSAGTFLQNGQRLPANQWVKVSGNFYLGSPNVMFSIKKGGGNIQPAQYQQPTQPAPLPQTPIATGGNVSITGLTGVVQGKTFSDPQRLVIGRDPTQCNVVLPARTPGVSRQHCILERRADGIYLMDVGSSAGTFLPNGQRLQTNQWLRITGNFYLGSPDVMFAVNP